MCSEQNRALVISTLALCLKLAIQSAERPESEAEKLVVMPITMRGRWLVLVSKQNC